MLSKVLPIAAIAGTTLAHGIVNGVTADGVYYDGYIQDYHYARENGGEFTDSVGWYHASLDNGYVGGDRTAYSSPDLICHKAAENAKLSAKVSAGGSLKFHWREWPDSHVGPMITYVANCGADCATVDKETLKFVKIEEYGLVDGEWGALKMIKEDLTWDTTVPSDLAPGNYVFRHETIALHGASNLNGAQNYPFCVNVEVTGSGTAETDAEGVLGTELYTSEDLVFDPWQGNPYTVPGPALWSGAGGSGSGSSPAPPTNGTSPAPPTGTAPPSGTVPSGTVPSGTVPSGISPSVPTGGAGSGSELGATFTVAELTAWLSANADADKEYTVEEIATLLSSAPAKVRRHARQFL